MHTSQKSSDDITVMDVDTSRVKQVVHPVTFNPLPYLRNPKRVNIHRPDVDVTHSHAGRNNMANSQHGVTGQALEQTGGEKNHKSDSLIIKKKKINPFYNRSAFSD